MRGGLRCRGRTPMASPALPAGLVGGRSGSQARRGQLRAAGEEGPLGSSAARCEGAQFGSPALAVASARPAAASVPAAPGAGFSPQVPGAERRMGTAQAENVWKLLGRAGGAGGGRPRGGIGARSERCTGANGMPRGSRGQVPGRVPRLQLAVFLGPIITFWSLCWQFLFNGVFFFFFSYV